MVLLGPPGGGKGTQSKLLEEKLGIPPISTGDILRAAVREGTALGVVASEYMEQGLLVPDSVIIGIVEDRLNAKDCKKGFLLDGFPRTVPQAAALEEMLGRMGVSLDAAVSLGVPRAEILSRLSGRRTCPDCGAMYHLMFNPPKESGICDRCEAGLYQREDDSEPTIRARLDVYEKDTAPVRDFFRERGSLCEVDGTGQTAQVFGRILACVKATA